jgi:Zn finger protein HypA/HybF involved in hydrogenase expression
MTLPKEKIYIQCERCGKKIEKKMNRVLCIHCRYEVDKENAEKRRNDPEYKQMYMEKYKRNKN